MSRSPAKRKQHVGPDLGLAPGEPGFAKWLRQSVADSEAEAKRVGTISEKEWLARTDRLLNTAPRKRSCGLP
jgi:hypothetical protein